MLYCVIKCEYWDNGNRCVYYLNDQSLVQESRLVPVPFSLRFYDARQRMIYSDAVRQQMKQVQIPTYPISYSGDIRSLIPVA